MNTTTIGSDWVGRVIDGRFTLLQWLGSSGAGGVFLTELEGEPSQQAAIKLIPAGSSDAEAQITEWAAAVPLVHPHLVRLLQTGRCEIDDTPLLYAVMEYGEENLGQILPERPLTPDEAKEMLGPVLDALGYLHGKGFVHGNLKPSNILVVENELKLSTDQLSVAGQSGHRSEAAGIYGAPEAARGALSPAADVWSLGVTLVEALTQHIPIADESGQADPRVPDSIPEPFAGIARECLRRDPARRCSLSDIKARLAGQRPLPVVAEITRAGDKAPSKLRTPALIAAALIVVALVAFLFLRSHHTEPSAPTAQNPAPAPAPPSLPAQAPIAEKPTAGDATVKGAVAEGEVVERVQPEVLPAATESIHGHVNLGIRVAVDPNGNVSEARLERAGPSRYFAKVALEAARKWRFKPAQVGGRPVASVWILKFEFTQAGTEITPVETSP